MLIRTRMFFRKWLSFSRKPSTRPVARRRRNRREAWFVEQAICSGLGVETLESRQLLTATVLGTSVQAPPSSVISGQVTSPIQTAVTPGLAQTDPAPTDPAQTQAANGVNQIGLNGVVGTSAQATPPFVISGQVTSPVQPAVAPGVAPTDPAQMPAANSVSPIGLNGVVGTGGGQASAIEPAVTPGVTPTVSGPAGVGPNSPPSASAPATASLNENSSLSFSALNSDAISITDAAAGTNADSLTLSVLEGTLTLASTTGLSFTAGANGTSSLTVSGTVTNLDSALDGLVYQPTTLYSGADSLAVLVSDPTDSLSASTSVSITVAALSAPAVSAPGGGSLSENGSLTLSSGNSNAISITDAAAGSNADSLALSASQGTLTLASSNGLSFSSGTNGSSTFTVSGTVTNLNAALNGLVYQPTSLYSGSDSLSVSVTDPGDTLSASTSVTLTVAALSAPAISVSASPSLTGDGSLSLSGGNGSALSFTDSAAGADSDSDSLSQSVSQGTMALGSATGLSLTTGTNSSATFTASSPVASVNSALTYPGDALSSSTNASLTVNALAAPAITASGTAPGTGNLSLVYSSGNSSAMSVIDAAAGSSSDSLSLSVSHGRLGPTTGLSFATGPNDSPSSTATGTIANLNAALNGLTNKPRATHVGSDSLPLSDSDRGDSLSGGTTVVFTATALSAPAIVAPPAGTPDPNGSLVFSTSNGNAISFRDADAGSGSNSLTLSVAHGTITLASTTGLSFTTGMNGSDSFTVTGTVANLNAALSGMVYTPTRNFSGSDSLAVKVSDPNGYALTNVALRVNVIAPTLTAPTIGTVPLNGTLTFYKRAIKIADVNASTDIEQVVLRATRGNLRLGSTTGITFVSGANNSPSMTISGTLTSLNALLNGLKFTPTTDFYGSGTISIKYTDAKNGLSVSTKIAVTIGTTHASFGPPIQTASHQSTGVSPASQSTPSTVGGTVTSPDLSGTLPADDLARWDRFMEAMGLLNRS
jgi:hypothetical protein